MLKQCQQEHGLTANSFSSRLTAACIGGVVEESARDDRLVAPNADGQAREGSRAREDIPSRGGAVGRPGNLRIVGLNNGSWEVDEGGTGVGDDVDALATEGARAHGIAAGGEFPESIGGVDGSVGDTTGVLRAVNVAEVVVTSLALLQVGSEDRAGELSLGVTEPGLHVIRGGGVDAIEREAHEPIVGGVAYELARNGLGSFDSLAGHGDAANGDLVEVNVALRTGAVAVGDIPRLA